MAFQTERRPLAMGGADSGDLLASAIARHNSRRNARRQRLVAHLHAAGPRPVLEALIQLSDSGELDHVLERYARIPVQIYRDLGADQLPIDEFELIDGRDS